MPTGENQKAVDSYGKYLNRAQLSDLQRRRLEQRLAGDTVSQIASTGEVSRRAVRQSIRKLAKKIDAEHMRG